MVLVLCIGDLHIPHRAVDLPAKFKALLTPGKIATVLCTGNLCTEETYDYLKSISPDVVMVQGEFDESLKWPDTAIKTIGDFKIGVCHGHQVVPNGDREALALLQRRLGVDILIVGSTHQFNAYRHEGCIVINPGSATGAYSMENQKPTPSFALMDVDGGMATVYVYELVNDEIKVDKIEFPKHSETTR